MERVPGGFKSVYNINFRSQNKNVRDNSTESLQLQFIEMTDVTGPYVFINKATMRLVKSYTAVFIETQCTHIQPPIEKGVETTLCVTTGFPDANIWLYL